MRCSARRPSGGATGTTHQQSQQNLLNRLLEAEPEGFTGGMTLRTAISLTKVSRATVWRDLAELGGAPDDQADRQGPQPRRSPPMLDIVTDGVHPRA